MQPSTQRQSGANQQSRRGTRTFRTAVGLPDETRRTVVGMLNQTLADTTDLMTQAKFAHWNVKGMNFYQLHQLFDELAETFEEHADIVAERATALGGEANGTVRAAAGNSGIPEMPPDVTTGREYVEALVERVGIHANNLRSDIEAAVECDDEDTADMYTELSREVDEQLYFLEAHVQAVESEAIPTHPGASIQGQTGPQGSSPSQYREGSEGQTGGRMVTDGRTGGRSQSQYGGPARRPRRYAGGTQY